MKVVVENSKCREAGHTLYHRASDRSPKERRCNWVGVHTTTTRSSPPAVTARTLSIRPLSGTIRIIKTFCLLPRWEYPMEETPAGPTIKSVAPRTISYLFATIKSATATPTVPKPLTNKTVLPRISSNPPSVCYLKMKSLFMINNHVFFHGGFLILNSKDVKNILSTCLYNINNGNNIFVLLLNELKKNKN